MTKSLYLSTLMRCLIYILIFSTTADEFADGLFISVQDLVKQRKNLLILYEGTQIIGAPIQAAISDLYCRKKMLVFTIAATLFFAILFQFMDRWSVYTQYLLVFLTGALANTIPIAWGGMANIIPHNRFRKYIAWSICWLAFGNWGSFYLIPVIPEIIFRITVWAILIINLIVAVKWFKASIDNKIKDNKTRPNSTSLKNLALFLSKIRYLPKSILVIWHEIIHLFKFFFKIPLVAFGVIIFTLTELSFLQIFMRIELLPGYNQAIPIALTAGLAYFVGTLFISKVKFSDYSMLITGIILSAIALVCTYIFAKSKHELLFFLISFYGLYSIAFAILTPSLFALINSKIDKHHSGKLFGLFDSGESLARVLITIFVVHTASFNFNKGLMVSLIIILISLVLTLYFIFSPRYNMRSPRHKADY